MHSVRGHNNKVLHHSSTAWAVGAVWLQHVISLLLSLFICNCTVLVLLWHELSLQATNKGLSNVYVLIQVIVARLDSVCFILGASNSVWIPLHPRHADVGAGRAVGDKSDSHTHSAQRSARCFEIRTERLLRAFFYHSSHTHMTFVCRSECNIMAESVQRSPHLNILSRLISIVDGRISRLPSSEAVGESYKHVCFQTLSHNKLYRLLFFCLVLGVSC